MAHPDDTWALAAAESQGSACAGLRVVLGDLAITTLSLHLQYQVDLAQLVTRRLQVSVWHLGTLTRRVFLGEVILPLATWDFEDSAAQNARWYPLRAKVCVFLLLFCGREKTP